MEKLTPEFINNQIVNLKDQREKVRQEMLARLYAIDGAIAILESLVSDNNETDMPIKTIEANN